MRQLVLTPDLRADSVDWQSMAGWKRFVLMGLMVALPIPVFAASGLAVPLPSIVYRAAVGIAESTQAVAVALPGFEAIVSETTQVVRRGTISLSPEELATSAAQPNKSVSLVEPRPSSTARRKPTASPAARRGPAQKASVRRPRAVGPVRAKDTEPIPVVASVALPASEPDTHRRTAPAPTPQETAIAKKEPAAPEPRNERSDPSPVRRPEPKPTAPKEEPKGGAPPSPPPPPPAPPTPPPLPSPLPVTTPIDPLPPVPLMPKAQLEEIAADLKEIVETGTVDRTAQALEKVQSAVKRLEKNPPDKQGAVGDIKNAVQKLDRALTEGEISLVERTLFVTRLNAVSTLLGG